MDKFYTQVSSIRFEMTFYLQMDDRQGHGEARHFKFGT